MLALRAGATDAAIFRFARRHDAVVVTANGADL